MKFQDLKNWQNYWQQLRAALLDPKVDDEALEQSLRQARERVPVPVLWLIGKTQAGKTSIIQALTGSEMAEVGNGIQPCTKHTHFYEYPADAPVVRFLDTRGLGEITYDPSDDIDYCESQAHLLLAVMKVSDLRQNAIFDVLSTIRQRHPDWPLLIAQTGLHELYPVGDDHILPWPYGELSLPDTIPNDLRQAILTQREAAEVLPGSAPIHWVAIDLTLPEDDFNDPNYGLDALWQEIELLSSLGLQQLLNGDKEVHDLYARTAHQHIIGYSLTASGLGALPVVDLVAVSAVQVKLLHGLATLYEQVWDKETIAKFFGLMGASLASGLLARMLGRSIVKLIPVWGQTVGAVWGASASGATTYALGKASVYFLSRRKEGLNVDAKLLRQVYTDALAQGVTILKARFKDKTE